MHQLQFNKFLTVKEKLLGKITNYIDVGIETKVEY